MTSDCPPPAPRGRAALALALSLALHASLLLTGVFWPRAGASSLLRPASVEAVALDDGRPPPDDIPGEGLRPGGAEEAEPFVATVLTVPSAAAAVHSEEAPVVVGVPGGGIRPKGLTAGTGSGPVEPPLLRPAPRARRIVYVVDRSISMQSHALNAARAHVLASLDALTPDARFQVVLYNSRAETLPLSAGRELVPATEGLRAEAARLLAAVTAEGGTDHVAALRRALLLEPDTIFLVTDADEMTPARVAAVTNLNGGRAVIHAVELRDGPPPRDDAPLPTLTRLNRGTHRTAPARR